MFDFIYLLHTTAVEMIFRQNIFSREYINSIIYIYYRTVNITCTFKIVLTII